MTQTARQGIATVQFNDQDGVYATGINVWTGNYALGINLLTAMAVRDRVKVVMPLASLCRWPLHFGVASIRLRNHNVDLQTIFLTQTLTLGARLQSLEQVAAHGRIAAVFWNRRPSRV